MPRHARLVLGVLLAALLSGCADANVYDGNSWDEWNGLQRPYPCDRDR